MCQYRRLESKMLVTEGFIRIVLIAFLEIISVDPSYANNRSCFDVNEKTICFFKPIVASKYINWDEAWNVCIENNATLPVIDDRMTAETLRRYLKYKPSDPVGTWLAGREIRTNDWRWLNGKLFGRQNSFTNSDGPKSQYETNAAITGGLQYMWSLANKKCYYICHYKESELCQYKSIIPWKNGCLFANNDKTWNFMDARNRCLDEGGDLATFEEDGDLDVLRSNSSLLYTNGSYWIGLRQNWWIWNETATSKEIKYSNWLYSDNLLNKSCLFIRVNDYKWDQSGCTAKKPFICQTVTTTSNTQGTDVESLTTTANRPTQETDVESFLSTRLPETKPTVSVPGGSVIIVASILVVTILLFVVIVAVIIILWKRKAKTRHSDQTRVETDGDYQDLRRDQHNPGSNDHYMELQGIRNQPAALSPDYQNISDYDDVILSHN